MTDTSSEDELVEKVAVAITGVTDELLEEDDYEAAGRALVVVMRELRKYANSKSDVIFTPRSFLGCFESEHGITLEDK